jgi:hypothetical protein
MSNGKVTRTWRFDQAETGDAEAHLPSGRSMTSFVRACLRALAARPDEFTAFLLPYWPDERQAGRPPGHGMSNKAAGGGSS